MEMATDASICDGPYDCRRATRHMIKYGADLIKITSTGGVMTDNNTGTGQQMTDDELREVVSAAAAMGRKVASHAHGTEGINAALRAGVASIEHGTYTDQSSIKLFLETGAYLVPTLLAGATVVEMAKTTNYLSDNTREKALRVGADMQGNFAKAYAGGVKVAYGTDSGISPHGDNAREAVLMREAGMSNEAILISATVNAADLIDMSDAIGTLEAGTPNIADAIALGTAIDFIRGIGFDAIGAHESALLAYATDALSAVPGLRIIGTARRKASVVSFIMGDLHPHDIGTIVDREGVAIRTGHHCAQPVMDRFGIPATARASLAMYNTTAEIDALVTALGRARQLLG
jgi:hypothetical protein